MSGQIWDDVVAGLGSKSLDALKATLADSWGELTSDEKASATKLMLTLAKTRLYEIAGYEVKDELEILEAAFLQWKVVGKQVVIDGARKAATEVLGLGGAFAGSALAAFLGKAL